MQQQCSMHGQPTAVWPRPLCGHPGCTTASNPHAEQELATRLAEVAAEKRRARSILDLANAGNYVADLFSDWARSVLIR